MLLLLASKAVEGPHYLTKPNLAARWRNRSKAQRNDYGMIHERG